MNLGFVLVLVLAVSSAAARAGFALAGPAPALEAAPQAKGKPTTPPGQGTTGKDAARDAEAQYQLALKYARGTGVARDDAMAAGLFRKAAEQGHGAAQEALAFAYHVGRGVEKNEAEALKWVRKAAEQGRAGAQHSLGFSYFTGT